MAARLGHGNPLTPARTVRATGITASSAGRVFKIGYEQNLSFLYRILRRTCQTLLLQCSKEVGV